MKEQIQKHQKNLKKIAEDIMDMMVKAKETDPRDTEFGVNRRDLLTFFRNASDHTQHAINSLGRLLEVIGE
uniref:Uncharacterized protein n=2 Tax=viral metagenome TaxID=1070528 RepID=A0A6M3LVW8_9ZZZZ